jgi:MSHA biogenesis protein MshN
VQSSGPASRLALDLEEVSPVKRPSARTGAGAQTDLPKKDAASQRTTESPAGRVVATEKSRPKPPLAAATVIASNSAVPVHVSPSTAKEGPARAAANPGEPPKLAVALPNAAATSAAAPAVATVKPATSTSRIAAVSPESVGQAALANPQIDKRSQALTPQQLAENEYREAANFLNQGRLAEAQEGFRRALQHNQAHSGARQGLFGLLLDAKNYGEAEQLLRDGLKLNPNQAGFAVALASLQYERGDIAGAIETMQKSAPAAQASPDYLARLAGLLQRQSRHKEAVENYQAALRLAPGSGVWLMGLGISLQALDRNAEAQDAFRRARSSNTLSPELQAFVDQRLRQLQ